LTSLADEGPPGKAIVKKAGDSSFNPPSSRTLHVPCPYNQKAAHSRFKLALCSRFQRVWCTFTKGQMGGGLEAESSEKISRLAVARYDPPTLTLKITFLPCSRSIHIRRFKDTVTVCLSRCTYVVTCQMTNEKVHCNSVQPVAALVMQGDTKSKLRHYRIIINFLNSVIV